MSKGFKFGLFTVTVILGAFVVFTVAHTTNENGYDVTKFECFSDGATRDLVTICNSTDALCADGMTHPRVDGMIEPGMACTEGLKMAVNRGWVLKFVKAFAARAPKDFDGRGLSSDDRKVIPLRANSPHGTLAVYGLVKDASN